MERRSGPCRASISTSWIGIIALGRFRIHAPRYHNYKQITGTYNRSDDILPAMGAVRRAVLSPDDLLGHSLHLVRSTFLATARLLTIASTLLRYTLSSFVKRTPERRLSLLFRKIGHLTCFVRRSCFVIGPHFICCVLHSPKVAPLPFGTVHPLRSLTSSSATLGRLCQESWPTRSIYRYLEY